MVGERKLPGPSMVTGILRQFSSSSPGHPMKRIPCLVMVRMNLPPKDIKK